jgi:hypothetical protein
VILRNRILLFISWVRIKKSQNSKWGLLPVSPELGKSVYCLEKVACKWSIPVSWAGRGSKRVISTMGLLNCWADFINELSFVYGRLNVSSEYAAREINSSSFVKQVSCKNVFHLLSFRKYELVLGKHLKNKQVGNHFFPPLVFRMAKVI